MTLAFGVLMLVLGAIFTFALQVNIPGLGEYALGLILMGAGLLTIVLSFFQTRARQTSRVVADVEERRVSAGSPVVR